MLIFTGKEYSDNKNWFKFVFGIFTRKKYHKSNTIIKNDIMAAFLSEIVVSKKKLIWVFITDVNYYPQDK
jgi:hypothetical protein